MLSNKNIKNFFKIFIYFPPLNTKNNFYLYYLQKNIKYKFYFSRKCDIITTEMFGGEKNKKENTRKYKKYNRKKY